MANEPQGCLGAILRLFGIKLGGSAAEELPYRLRDNFLSAAELSFYHVLESVCREQYTICSKVRVSDLIYVTDRRNNMGHANRIDRKHVDFVLCQPKTMQPQLVIELDDSSHQRADRVERDRLVDAAFQAAGLPILHIPVRRSYSTEEIQSQIGSSTDGEFSRKQMPAASKPKLDTPLCPRCDIEMVARRASRGKHKGKQFWACPGYPDCKETVSID